MKHKTLILLILIVLIAFFFRLWRLNSVPPGLYIDEAMNGNDAINAIKTGNLKVFYPENNGREGFFINLISLSFLILGASTWAIRAVPAVIGILTVLGLYLLTKELFVQATPAPDASSIGAGQASDKQPQHQMPPASVRGRQATSIALLSSFFLAVSFWHVNFSRIGFRAILVPFILVFSFYFLFRAFRTKKTCNLIISGIFFGLGFSTYIAFLFAVLLLSIILFCCWLVYKKKNLQKIFTSYSLYLLITIFVIALPLGIYFLKNPQDLNSRAAGILVFTHEHPIKAFVKSLILHLGMFNFYGDPNWRHNFAGSPMLIWPVGILFLTGLIYSIKKLTFSIKTKNYSLLTTHYSLLSWFFVMLLPGVLTYEGIPHALRTIGAIPAIYIFSALGGYKTYQLFQKNTSRKMLLFLACFLFLVATIFVQYKKYFIDWGIHPETGGAFSEDYVKIGNYLNSLSPEIQNYVIVNRPGVPVPYSDGIPMSAQTIMFIENTKFGKPRSVYLLPEDLDQVEINEKPIVIIPLAPSEDLFNQFRQKFPSGIIQKREEFWVYEIK